MNGDPHGGATQRLRDFEVGVVLMPCGAHSGLAGLQKNLIEMERDFRTDQARDGVDHLRREGERANQRAVEVSRTQLEVLFGYRTRFAIALGGDIAEVMISLQTCDVGLERGGFRGVKEGRHGKITALLE